MRLLNAKTLALESFHGDNVPSYAILSHTWGDEEVSLQDLESGKFRIEGEGFLKIRWTCQQALDDTFTYCWVDTCCIDKTSSAELSEAINSMYEWYAKASVCYAYLANFQSPPRWLLCPRCQEWSTGDKHSCSGFTTYYSKPVWFVLEFGKSRWWRRGWTLQELVAPRELIFFGSEWTQLGSRKDLQELVREASRIETKYLNHISPLSEASIARRMSWAARRETSRKEDEAYCLLGVFEVNMPLLYGEGQKAFLRLQEEIIKTSTDQSIFSWEWSPPEMTLEHSEDYERHALQAPILAISPRQFWEHNGITLHEILYPSAAYEMNNAGLRINLPVLQMTEQHFVVLNCKRGDALVAVKVIREKEPQTWSFTQSDYGTRTVTLSEGLVASEATMEPDMTILRERRESDFFRDRRSVGPILNQWLEYPPSLVFVTAHSRWPRDVAEYDTDLRGRLLLRVRFHYQVFSRNIVAAILFRAVGSNEYIVVASSWMGIGWKANAHVLSFRPKTESLFMWCNELRKDEKPWTYTDASADGSTPARWRDSSSWKEWDILNPCEPEAATQRWRVTKSDEKSTLGPMSVITEAEEHTPPTSPPPGIAGLLSNS